MQLRQTGSIVTISACSQQPRAAALETLLPLSQIGRPVVYGLASAGEAGVKKVLQMLRDELELAMALVGCPNVKDINRSIIVTPQDTIREAQAGQATARL